MKLNYEVEKSMSGKGRESKWMQILEEFVNSGKEVARIDFNETDRKHLPKNPSGSIRASIRLRGLPVTLTVRRGELFLIRK